MDAAPERLLEVQHAISERNDSRWPVEPCEKLLFCRLADAIHIEFSGLPFDESFENFIEAIYLSDVAPS